MQPLPKADGDPDGLFFVVEPMSHFSSGSHETAKGSYHALEEELSQTMAKLGTVEQDLDIQRCV